MKLPNRDVVRLTLDGPEEGVKDVAGCFTHARNRTTEDALVTSGVWQARYPDLAGKVAVVTGDFGGLVALVTALAANDAPICVVADDRGVVDAALAAAAASAGAAMGITASPSEPGTWQRVVAHAEQRLGPIDVLIAAGSVPARSPVIDAVLPDMAARGRGVVVEVSEDATSAGAVAGVRRRSIVVDDQAVAADVAAAVALCASDVLTASTVTIRLAH